MLCFVHIPKTAGTTVSSVFRRSLGAAFMELNPWMDDQRIISPADLEMLRRWAPWIKHFGGHHVRAYSGLERAMPGMRYMTFLRDPVRRCSSEYFHMRNKNGRVANFHEYLSNRAWRNIQTKYVAGRADVEAAKQVLAERFQFVGLVESMDESLVMLRRTFADLPLDVRYGRPRNTAVEGPAQQEVRGHRKEFESRLLENNALDCELYAYARDVLFPRQKKAYGPQLNADIAGFRSSNRIQRGNILSFYVSRAFYKVAVAMYRRFGRRKWPIDNRRLNAEYDFFGEYVF